MYVAECLKSLQLTKTQVLKKRLMALTDELPLRQRAIIVSILDQLKNISQIEHPRHRSLANFLVNQIGG